MNTTQSEKLYAQALDFMPGGVNSPVRAVRSEELRFLSTVQRVQKFMMLTETSLSTISAHGDRTSSVTNSPMLSRL